MHPAGLRKGLPPTRSGVELKGGDLRLEAPAADCTAPATVSESSPGDRKSSHGCTHQPAVLRTPRADAEPDLLNALELLTDYLDRCACDLSELHSRQARKTRVFAT